MKTIKLIEKYNIDPQAYMVRVSKKAISYKGTSAGLRKNDNLCLLDLIYGMMLPSGNDAAYSIAETLGRLILERDQIEENELSQKISSRVAVEAFLDEMNRVAQDIDLNSSQFVNPHGLGNQFNLSSAICMAKLVQNAMKLDLFCKVVKTITYSCTIQNDQKKQRTVTWENTNKLLSRHDCQGVKTGYTPNAGPCLAAHFKKENEQNGIIIILLKTEGQDERFSEATQLIEHFRSYKQFDHQ